MMTNLDVYRFSYSAEWRTKLFEPSHCFDGQLIYREGVLTDTYWGIEPRGDGGRRFSQQEAEQKGALTFVCNLNDVEQIQEHLFPQYADGDAFNLSHQHGCYKYFVVKKGARKSTEKRLAILAERVKTAKHEAEYAMRAAFNRIEQCQEQRYRLESGEDISV